MFYNIVDLCDIHSGVMDIDLQLENMEIINEFISQYNEIDLVVISGDYFESKLPLNSKAAILSVNWIHTFLEKCKKANVKRVRMFKGTEDHDNDQLEVFRCLEDKDGFFRLFNENTVEETLPGLKCIYCPDENIPTKEYVMKYLDNIYSCPNIGFFHGSFDVVLPDIIVQLSETTSMKNVIFEYDFWKKFINGPMLSGHWHDGNTHDHLIYIGSYDRWTFGEENPKGFGFIRYNTETNEYFYKKITNIFAPEYITFSIYSNVFNSIDDYNNLIKEVDNTLIQYRDKGTKIKIRILINANDDKPDNETFFTSLKHYYINNSLVKIVIKNKVKKEKKEAQVRKNVETRNKFGFILDKSKKESEKIQQYILLTKNKEHSIDIIERTIKKYIK